MKREIYSFVCAVKGKKTLFLLSLPMVIYIIHRLILRFVRHKEGVPINKVVFFIALAFFIIPAISVIWNIVCRIKLKKRLASITGDEEKQLESDFRSGTMYLDKTLFIGQKYIISKGSLRLFSFDELSGVFDDIRETYNVLEVIIHRADDVVKTKIIKAEYKGKNFLHDRRICEIQVHKRYLSDVGETTGYEQLATIEAELRAKIERYAEGE